MLEEKQVAEVHMVSPLLTAFFVSMAKVLQILPKIYARALRNKTGAAVILRRIRGSAHRSRCTFGFIARGVHLLQDFQ